MGSKRGSAVGAGVLEAPEDDSMPEVESPRRRRARAAAPSAPEPMAEADTDIYDEPAFRRQGGGGAYTVRVRPGLPKSWVGRVAFVAGLLAVVAVISISAAGLRRAVLHDSRFVMTTSSDIQVTGNKNVTRAEVLSVFGADLERNIFRVPLEERRADLERLPWVSHATVMRLLPNQIRVAVTERTPVAFTRQGTQIGLVDANGVLLDMPQDAAGDPHYSFPVLTGLSGKDPLSTRAARMAIFERFMRELDSSGEKLTKSLSEVDVSNPEDVKALVATGSSDILVHFGDEQFLERYHAFQQHLPEWKQQYPKLASADMRYERQVVLEMQPGTGVPLAGDATASATSQAAGASETEKLAAHSGATAVHPKARPATSAGKAKPSNARIFADLAAQRRAEQRKKAAQKTTARAGAR